MTERDDRRRARETIPARALRQELAAVKAALQQVLSAQRGHGRRATLVVRGQADPAEDRGEQNATARAKAVHHGLVAQRIDRAQLRIVSLGGRLPVSHAGNPPNARVDALVIEAP